MLKEPQNWWVKIIISTIISVIIATLIMIVTSLIYGLVEKVNWHSLITKPYSGWVTLVIFIIVWSIQEYKRKQKERKKREGLTKISIGGKSLFGTFEEHEGKHKRNNE